MKKITNGEIAKLANVSAPTLKKFQDGKEVRKSVADRIKKAKQTLQLDEPDPALTAVKKASKTKKTAATTEPLTITKHSKESLKTLRFRLLCNDISTPHTRHMISALQEILIDAECIVEIMQCKSDEKQQEYHLKNMRKDKIDGIIIESAINIQMVNEYCSKLSIPTIFLCETNDICETYVADEFQAGEVLGTHLLKHQHLSIRYLGIDESLANQRLAGVRKVYFAKNQPIDLKVFISNQHYTDMFEKVKDMFNGKIDLIILERDEIAIPLSKYLHEYHIYIPQNASIVSFGGHEITKVMSPTISSIAFNYEAYAKYIKNVIFAILNNKKLPSKENFYRMEAGESMR